MKIYEKKHLQVWVLKKNLRPVLLETLAAMYVTCDMFLILCFDFNKSSDVFSFHKVHLLLNKTH